MIVAFFLRPDGHVERFQVTENTTGHECPASCVVIQLSTIDLGVAFHGEPVEFIYPFIFAPQNEPDEREQ